jgi:hypothetical protein
MRYADRKGRKRWRMPKDKLRKMVDELQIQKAEPTDPDPENGSEYPRYKMFVDENERGYIIELLNIETAYRDLVCSIPEYLGEYTEECGLPSGLYNCIIRIDGDGPSYWGEYDSWLVFEDIKVYKLKDEDLVDFEYDTVHQE